MDDVVHERLTGVDVRAARVVVGAVVAEERRVDEVHVGQPFRSAASTKNWLIGRILDRCAAPYMAMKGRSTK
jgi:hypothetical protein